MGLINVLRAGVKAADRITKPIQVTVTLEHYAGQDVYGDKIYGPPVALRAIVDWKQHQVRTMQGVLSVSRSSVTFLDPRALAAATNGEGLDDFDRITLPDGTTGPILDMSGFIDVGTKLPLATEVFIG